MMLPRPAATIVSPKIWHGSSAPPTRFRSKTPCQPLNGNLQKSPPGARVPSGLLPPAPLTSTLTAPHLPQDGVPAPGQASGVHRVGRLEDRPAARRLDGANALHAALLAAADDRDARPGGRKRLGHRPAQNACAAEDDGGLLFQIEQIGHEFYPFRNSGFK